jgi:hypothetical protein
MLYKYYSLGKRYQMGSIAQNLYKNSLFGDAFWRCNWISYSGTPISKPSGSPNKLVFFRILFSRIILVIYHTKTQLSTNSHKA